MANVPAAVRRLQEQIDHMPECDSLRGSFCYCDLTVRRQMVADLYRTAYIAGLRKARKIAQSEGLITDSLDRHVVGSWIKNEINRIKKEPKHGAS